MVLRMIIRLKGSTPHFAYGLHSDDLNSKECHFWQRHDHPDYRTECRQADYSFANTTSSSAIWFVAR